MCVKVAWLGTTRIRTSQRVNRRRLNCLDDDWPFPYKLGVTFCVCSPETRMLPLTERHAIKRFHARLSKLTFRG